MASYTTNLNLKKPAGSENVAIGDINNNMDAIDAAYGTLNSKMLPETHTDGAIKYSKCSGIAMINIAGAVSPDANGKIGNVPAGYRPDVSTYFFVTTGGNVTNAPYLAYVKSDGDVVIYTRGDNIAYAYGSCSYCIYS